MLEALSIGGLVLGLTQVAKLTRIAGKKGRFAPLIAVVIGIASSFAIAHAVSLDLALVGIVTSLSVQGLYGGTKKVIAG